jgi:hypothetical protein
VDHTERTAIRILVRNKGALLESEGKLYLLDPGPGPTIPIRANVTLSAPSISDVDEALPTLREAIRKADSGDPIIVEVNNVRHLRLQNLTALAKLAEDAHREIIIRLSD